MYILIPKHSLGNKPEWFEPQTTYFAPFECVEHNRVNYDLTITCFVIMDKFGNLTAEEKQEILNCGGLYFLNELEFNSWKNEHGYAEYSEETKTWTAYPN